MVNKFNCQSFDGDVRLMEDLQIICYSGYHWIFSIGLAFPCLLIYGVGVPAAVLMLMRKEKERLDTIAAKEKFGFLYNGYKRSNYFWEIIIMYRKILCIFVSVFMNRIGIIVQALVILIILVAFLQFNSGRRPFIARALNDVEDLSLITSVITIYCALFFLTSKDPTSQGYDETKDFNLNPTGQLILFLMIVISNIVFLSIWVTKYIFVMRLMIKEKMTKLYICLFLCCRNDKFVKENEKLATEKKNETIIEKIEEIQFFLKNMKKLYTKQIFFNDHLKFLKMLYYIEFEKNKLDLTEKKHNFYIQGKMARDRKFDPERMKEILDEKILPIDEEFGGSRILKQHFGLNKQQKKLKILGSDSSLEASKTGKSLLNKNSNRNLLDETKDKSSIGLLGFLDSEKHDEQKKHLLPKIMRGIKTNIIKLQKMEMEQLDQTKAEEEVKEDESNSQRRRRERKNQLMEARLARSRNDIQKLRKKQKEKMFASSDDEDFKSKEQNIKQGEDVIEHNNDPFFKDQLLNYAEDDEMELSQTQEQMIMQRNLTKRIKDQEMNKQKKKQFKQGDKGNQVHLKKVRQGTQDSNKMNSQSSGLSQVKGEENAVKSQKSNNTQNNKKLSIEEALRLLVTNKSYINNKNVHGDQRLRPPTMKRREIMIGNFIEVHEIRGKKQTLQFEIEENKEELDKQQNQIKIPLEELDDLYQLRKENTLLLSKEHKLKQQKIRVRQKDIESNEDSSSQNLEKTDSFRTDSSFQQSFDKRKSSPIRSQANSPQIQEENFIQEDDKEEEDSQQQDEEDEKEEDEEQEEEEEQKEMQEIFYRGNLIEVDSSELYSDSDNKNEEHQDIIQGTNEEQKIESINSNNQVPKVRFETSITKIL